MDDLEWDVEIVLAQIGEECGVDGDGLDGLVMVVER